MISHNINSLNNKLLINKMISHNKIHKILDED